MCSASWCVLQRKSKPGETRLSEGEAGQQAFPASTTNGQSKTYKEPKPVDLPPSSLGRGICHKMLSVNANGYLYSPHDLTRSSFRHSYFVGGQHTSASYDQGRTGGEAVE
jgi:hypothetical protein